METGNIDRAEVLKELNQILELELAAVVRYTHYSLMVFGHNRIPIVSWFRSQATESLAHAHEAGEWITALGAHPSLAIGPLLETHKHKINEILKESAETEKAAMNHYYALMRLVNDRNVALEEYSRKMIHAEEVHLTEVEKMLWTAGGN